MIMNYERYTIRKEAEYGGLFVVRLDGVKIGQTQTEAGAMIIRRRHAQRMEGGRS